jgi:hypothetical protein
MISHRLARQVSASHDVSMTSALLGSWAVSGLKVPLGRKWPSGLGPVGPGTRSPELDPDLPCLV